jgi:hypothetical protein
MRCTLCERENLTKRSTFWATKLFNFRESRNGSIHRYVEKIPVCRTCAEYLKLGVVKDIYVS